MDFSAFDKRRYPTLAVEPGYAEWAESYESTVLDLMDLRILSRIESVDWAAIRRAADLGCGTGRVGVWLKQAGVAELDGVDVTAAMLAKAAGKRAYARLLRADIATTGLDDGAYDLVVTVLVDEHLATLGPLYCEAARLVRDGGRFVIVGYHPHFLMLGIPTHFDRPSGESVAIECHVHLISAHIRAAHDAGLRLAEMDEGVVDDTWIAAKPRWAAYRHQPVSFAMVWAKAPA